MNRDGARKRSNGERERHMRKTIEIVLGGLVVLAGCEQMGPSDPAGEALVGETAALRQEPGADNDLVRCPREVPATLNPPADATLAAGFPARGVQIYTCAAATAGAAPAWTLKAPHAVLFEDGEAAVIHFAGPSWQALDGSLVTGTKAASAPASDGTSIPQLLLQAASNGSPGLLSDVTWIQRLATVGGAAPAIGCDDAHLNAQVLVPYRAAYFFYRAAAAGKHVHQCAGI
jgi:hypothetical protein